MDKEKICLSSSVVELSETKTYLEMVNRVCFYGRANLNGTTLPVDKAEEFAQSLVDMPVYAKYRVNDKGEPTFGSHEAYIDDEGELAFDTTPIGVHTSVEIKDDTVSVGGEQATLPCLFATQRVWTRNKNAIAAIKRLHSEGKLHNSWEICVNSYTFENGVKTLTDYEFVGNTLLGYEYADPAYGESAKVLSVSETQMLVAEALSQDMLEQHQEKEAGQMEENIEFDANMTQPEEISEQNSEPEDAETPEQTETSPEEADIQAGESASLTHRDILMRIEVAARDMLRLDCWVSYLFPEEHKALLRMNTIMDDLSFTQVDYAVNSDDTVTVSNPTEIKLVVSVLQINKKVEELNDTISTLNADLNAAKQEIEELKPFREAAEKAAHEKKEKELRSYLESSKQFTSQELEGEEINELVASLDEAKIKAMIADRVVSASVNKNNKPTKAEHTPKANVADSMNSIDAATVMRNFLAHH